MTTTTEHDLIAAMARVDDIHAHQTAADRGEPSDWPARIRERDISGAWYLALEYLGTNAWAATFDISLEPEWYEDDRIGLHPTAVRASTAAAAINGACDRVYAFVEQARREG